MNQNAISMLRILLLTSFSCIIQASNHELDSSSQSQHDELHQSPVLSTELLIASYHNQSDSQLGKNETNSPEKLLNNKDLKDLITSSSTTTENAPATVKDSLDFGFKKCCPNKEILHLAPSGKPKCETLHGLELPDLVPMNMGGSNRSIPRCINGTLTVVEQFVESEEDKNTTNADEFCNDFAIEDGSFIRTVALVCVYPVLEKCESAPQSCVSLCCKEGYVCKKPHIAFYVNKTIVARDDSDFVGNQNISVKDDGVYTSDHVKLAINDYCIDATNIDQDNVARGAITGSKLKVVQPLPMKNVRTLMSVLLGISVVSLMGSLVIHMVVPDLRTSLFSWMKIAYMFSFLCSLSILFTMLVGGQTLITQFTEICQILGFSMHFFFLASFFWLNVMSFDIWRAFRRIRGFNESKQKHSSKQRRFIYYSIYAWGTSLFISMVTIMMQNLPENLTVDTLKPNIGVKSCFFSSNWSKWVYFHAPVSVLLTANVVFFFLSSWALILGVWAPSTSDRIKKKTKQRFWVVVELFFVMGLMWAFEIFNWAFGWASNSEPFYFTLVFDIANALQGFVIFLIVIMKSRILKVVKRFIRGIPSSVSVQSSMKSTMKKFESDITRRMSTTSTVSTKLQP